MPLVKKVKGDWNPAEARYIPGGLKVGDTIVITDPRDLLKAGVVVLVDEKTGKEISSVADLICPVCQFVTQDLVTYQNHIAIHTKEGIKKEEPPVIVKSAKIFKCKKCGFETDKPILLAVHTRKEHGAK